MPGGILNILATGNQNVFLTGNPKKTFFKAVYAKYTNFGLQKFRIDFNGLRTLRMTEDSLFTFKIPRYGDLLMDTYLVIQLPHIWSPIQPPTSNDSAVVEHLWRPYEFKWIKNLGTQMIERVKCLMSTELTFPTEFSGRVCWNRIRSQGQRILPISHLC